MLINCLKSSLRYLCRNRLFTALNILGLSIGLSASWVIFCVVDFEFSFDRQVPGRKNIYRVISGFVYDGKESLNGGVSKPLPRAIAEQVAGIRRVVRVYNQYQETAKIKEGEKVKVFDEPENVVGVDASYFSMVPYVWLAGNKEKAMSRPDALILTQSRAQKYFRGVDPDLLIGKVIFYNDTLKKVITGVVDDLNYPTTFAGKEFFGISDRSYPEAAWTSTNGDDKVYIELSEHAKPENVLAQINHLSNQKWESYNQKRDDPFTKIRHWHELRSLSEMHFTTEINEGVRKASKPVLYGLMCIAAFLLLLAVINYINLSTAQIPQRTKEFGVRKTLGSARYQLIAQIVVETSLITLFALLLSFAFSELMFFGLTDIIPQGVTLYVDYRKIILFALIITVTIPLLAGGYPAWLVANLAPLRIIQNRLIGSTGGGLGLRKSLIVFQFIVAQVFIISTLIVASQMRYLMHKDLGFDKEAVLLIEIPWKIRWKDEYKGKQFALFNELKNVPGVKEVSLGDPPLQDGYSSSEFTYSDPSGKKATGQLYGKYADTNYLSLYRVPLIAGRNVRAADTANEMLINQTAIKHFGFKSPEDALGKVMNNGDRRLTIVGVIRDFHTQSFYNKIVPTAVIMDKQDLATFNIRISPTGSGNWDKTVALVREKWEQFYPAGEFEYKFYDQSLEAIYKHEKNIALLVNIATIISIIISCLGLFGLAALSAFQKTKEIGIRKVLGASVSGIVRMLSLDFLKPVLIAISIGSPVAWYFANKWLEGFVYRVAPALWMFCAAGIIAIAIALLTVSLQAIRAATARPVDSLRSE